MPEMIEDGRYRYALTDDAPAVVPPHPVNLLAIELCRRRGIDPRAIYRRAEVYLHDPLVRRWSPLTPRAQTKLPGVALTRSDAFRLIGRLK